MMKKTIVLWLLLFVWGGALVSAQVRIGGSGDPNAAAVLDLNKDNNSNDKGLLLPRVSLSSTTSAAPLNAHVGGMTVFNTATANDVTPGIYYNNGSKWIRIANGEAPVITAQPAPFTFRRLKETYGDPQGPATATAVSLSVTATGPGTLTYRWYEKSKNLNNPVGTYRATGQNYSPAVTAWGMRSYYCVVSNGTDSVQSNAADVAVGCGAKTTDGGWLGFMCYNLGAKVTAYEELDAITFANDTTSEDAKGWLFQWGRIADGHQWRSSATVAGPYNSTTDVEVPSGDAMYGKFITTNVMATFYDWRTPQYSWAWYGWKSANDPCPAGWHVPSQTSWGKIIADGADNLLPTAATANAWTWSTNGYRIKPDGTTTTLFLPAAGSRDISGGIYGVGSDGYYWSSTASGSGSFNLFFFSGWLSPGDAYYRATGRSVRCIAD
jgi:uncharacterized protein (TIGR02145 family)